MSCFSKTAPFNAIDKGQLLGLVIFLKLFRRQLRARYIASNAYDPKVYNERHEFYFRNGKRLIDKCAHLLASHGYPEISREYDQYVEKLRDGYSLSRFGDGEFAILKAPVGQRVYFDRVTADGKDRLMRVLRSTNQKHLLGLIHSDVISRQLTFANAMSLLKKHPATWIKPRMPIFSEYDKDILEAYRALTDQSERIVEAGLFRNRGQQKHVEIWQDKDVLYVTGSAKTSEAHGVSVETMFDDAKSLQIIETVTENALSDHYDDILKQILSHPDVEKKMILISQGMAGTVLAFDLAEHNCHAIDLGQPFIYYRSRIK